MNLTVIDPTFATVALSLIGVFPDHNEIVRFESFLMSSAVLAVDLFYIPSYAISLALPFIFAMT